MSYKLRTNCLKFSPVLAFLLFFQFVSAQPGKKAIKEIGVNTFPSLDAFVQQNAKLLGTDFTTMVWTDTLVYKREAGDFDAKTVAPIGHSSEWLTAALVLKLVEEGKIALDDKVSQYLPIFETYGKNYITIRHCLTHFTGIQTDGRLFEKKKFGSLEAEVESYAKKEIKTNPGTEFRYSAVGPNIAGRILEVVMKKKFDMLIKQKLFNPLGMRKTTFDNLDGSAISPADGAQSSAEEYLRFLKVLLNKGLYNGQPFLSEESIKTLRSLTTAPTLVRFAPKTAEGLGFALGSWIVDEGKDGEAGALAGIGLTGTFPLVDWCRGYALLILPKKEGGEMKKETGLQLKDAVDEVLKSKCR